MLSDSEVEFVDRGYGKNYVRLLQVKRAGTWHQIKEIEVSTALTLSSTKDYVSGDNSDIVATDTQKNTVYVLAKQYGVGTIEQFAMRLAKHFLDRYSWVTKTNIKIEEKPWSRVQQGEKDHAHAFVESGDATRFCQVVQRRGEPPSVSAGLSNMKIMKTTKSAFVNFHRDEYRTLPDMDDRVFCTVVLARWRYDTTRGLNFDKAWSGVKSAILDVFAGPPSTGVFSPSVQKTVYDAQKVIMAKVPQISEVFIEFPNVHAYTFDYSKFPAFGITTNEQIFQPTDKPSGNIQATLKRKQTTSKL